VVVFADSKKDSASLPAGVKDVRADAGSYIPMVFVTTADGSKGLVGVSYTAMKEDMRGTVRDVREKIEEIDVLAGSGTGDEPAEAATSEVTTASGSDTARKSELFAESQEWTNDAGQTITAAITRVEGTNVQFKMPNGQTIDYPLAKLSAASQEKIRALQE